MNIIKKATLVITCALIAACSTKVVEADYNIVPLPNQITKIEGNDFKLTSSTQILYPENNSDLERVAKFLSEYINQATGINITPAYGNDGKNAIILKADLSSDNSEAYKLTVEANKIIINGTTPAGTFYGVQTLRKAMPALANGANVAFPEVEINDAPRFGYRGMMLDVGRHFFTIDSVKRYIDMLAFHNMNRLHWHLTDDQGWRIEIKSYPKLTEVGSIRKETVVGHNDSGVFDGKQYGGYYTQEEAKEIVKYAQDRFITIIPEIDLPGHMSAALASYPELGCTGKGYSVATKWGVFEDVLCVGNDSTIQFIKDVLNEIVQIFPSEYIHVGGDECPKTKWAECPKCQARIKKLGLKADKEHTAEEKLQSWCIQQAEQFLAEKGRKIIGWDEILEGGIAPNATVMSWRGMDGGYAAAKQKHDAIMTPNSHVYFDYYQSQDTENEPLAIGGFLPVERVYNLEPIPSGLNEEEQKHIIGVQANLWTEYIPTFSQVEYMVLPRMTALSEVQWTQPENKNYYSFLKRLPKIIEFFDRDHFNYAKHLFDAKAEIKPNFNDGTADIVLSTCGNNDIHYTLDGTTPTQQSPVYKEPIKVNKTVSLSACVFRNGQPGKVIKENITFNKATIKKITLQQQPSLQYTFDGPQMLVDGLYASNVYSDGRWIGFKGNDLDAIIDLGQPTEISYAGVNLNINIPNWIMNGEKLTVLASEDGTTFKEVASKEMPKLKENDPIEIKTEDIKFEPVTARYFRIIVKNAPLPEWHGAKGQDAFIFADEIILK